MFRLRISSLKYIFLFYLIACITGHASQGVARLSEEQPVSWGNDDDSVAINKFNLDEVVVTATRTPKRLSQSPVITQVVTARQIEDRGLSDIKSLLTQEIPGLVFNEVGFGTSINLQGLGGKHILFLVDGERMAGETGDNIDYQRLELNNIERIEIVQGAASALYGSQAMGGVINIITRKQKKPFSVSVSAKWAQPYERNFTDVEKDDRLRVYKRNADRPNLNADITVGGKWRKWTGKSVLSYKSADAYRLFDTDSVVKYFPEYDYTLRQPRRTMPTLVSGYGGHNFTQTITYAPTEKLSFSAKGNLYAMDKYDLSLDNKYEQNTDASGSLNAVYRLSDFSDFQVSLYADNYNRYRALELLPGQKEHIYRHRLLQPRAQYTFRVGSQHALNTGVEYLYESLYADKFEAERYQERNQRSGSLYVQDDWSVTRHFSVVAGIRADYHNAYGFNVSPKVAAIVKRFPFTLRFNYAAGYRSPNLKELYMNWDHLGMFMIYGNAALRPERNHYFSLSAEYVSEYLYAVATGYVNLFSDKIEGVWTNNQTELHYRNISSTTLAGANANVRVNPLKNLFVYATVNYLHPGRRGGVRLNTQSVLTATTRAEYAFRIGKQHVVLNVSGTLLGSKKYSVLEKIRPNHTEVEAYYTARVPGYSLWNASATWRFSERARLTLGVDNLFDYRAEIINFNTYTGPGRNAFAAVYWSL